MFKRRIMALTLAVSLVIPNFTVLASEDAIIEDTVIEESTEGISGTETVEYAESTNEDFTDYEEVSDNSISFPIGNFNAKIYDIDKDDVPDIEDPYNLLGVKETTEQETAERAVGAIDNTGNFNYMQYSSFYEYNALKSDVDRQFWDTLLNINNNILNSQENISFVKLSGDVYVLPVKVTTPYDYSELNRERILEMYVHFVKANPQYYYLFPGIYSIKDDTLDKLTVYFVTYGEFAYSTDRQRATSEVLEFVRSVVSGTSGMSDYEKIKYIHDRILDSVTYDTVAAARVENSDTDYNFSQTCYSLIHLGKSICAGYSQTFTLLANACGIPATSVSSKGHRWNVCYYNDDWYAVDTTWDDNETESHNNGHNYYNYFLKNESYLLSHDTQNAHVVYMSSYAPVAHGTSDSSGYNAKPTYELTEYSAEPTISYSTNNGKTTVTISASYNAEIYYAVEGREGETLGTNNPYSGKEYASGLVRCRKYNGPVEQAGMIYACAREPGKKPSTVASKRCNYGINFMQYPFNTFPCDIDKYATVNGYETSITGSDTIKLPELESNYSNVTAQFIGWIDYGKRPVKIADSSVYEYDSTKTYNLITEIPTNLSKDYWLIAVWDYIGGLSSKTSNLELPEKITKDILCSKVEDALEYLCNYDYGTPGNTGDGIMGYKFDGTYLNKETNKIESVHLAMLYYVGFKYTGKPVKPHVIMYDTQSNKVLKTSAFSISYKNTTNVSNGFKIIAKGKTDKYKGVKVVADNGKKASYVNMSDGNKTYDLILARSLNDANVAIVDSVATYKEGKEQKKNPEIYIFGNKLPKSAYKIEFSGNQSNKGDCKISITPNGKYTNLTGKTACKMVITDKIPANKLKVKISKAYYDGKEQKAVVSVKYKKTELKEGKDYELRYVNNIVPGTALAIITGKGEYAGSTCKTFKIRTKKK